MWFRSLLKSLKSRSSGATFRRSHRPCTARLAVEVLDDRCLPSTFTVTNLLDTGAGSLRAAVAAANANPGADTIDFATTGTIALTSEPLYLTDSVTINGPGASALTVSGNNAHQVFSIFGVPTVLIANLTVANGASDSGGGLSVGGGTLTLDQCTVTGNYARGSDGYDDDASITGGGHGGNGGDGCGGGLYVGGGVVHVNQCTISGNHAAGGNGGAGYSYNYYGGIGGNGGAGLGGGVYVAGGRVDFSQSTVTDNTALGGNGGFGDISWGADGGAVGGIYIEYGFPPLADLDTFTESHTVNNFAGNIVGPYSLNGAPALAISGVSTLEGNTGTTAFVFTVSLSAPSSQAVSVNYATADLWATAGSDYQSASGTLTFAPGETSKTVTIQVIGDRLAEAEEAFLVNLSAPTNATIARGESVGIILDDEPRINIGDRTVTEGNTGVTSATFAVYLSTAYDVPVSVNYATADGTATAGSDYQAASGTLTFAPGETSKTVTVQVIGDRLAESNETFAVNLSSPTNATITDGQGVGTIVDDEPRISISDVTKSEGRKNQTTLFTFTVTLSVAYDQPVTVSYRTTDGTATTGDGDYVAKTGTITFAPGETTKTITITVNGDNKKEATEYFYLDLSDNSSNSLFTKNRGTGTILNDD